MNKTKDSPTVDLTDVKSFGHWVTVTLRPSDVDSWNHINNVVYSAFFAAGRTQFMREILEVDSTGKLDFVLASVKIDFRRELQYPGSVDVGTRILRIGNSSMTLGHGLFRDGQLSATAESVVVCRDRGTRKVKPVPDEARRAFIATIPAAATTPDEK
ncbi:MAG: acyl-CoA thioesterase [Rhodospirillales bacterium]|nr:acyl-CoA thioesterase [Rhodospirillales bacterium]